MQDDSVVLECLTPELFNDAFSRYCHYQDQQWRLVDCLSLRRDGALRCETSLEF